MITEAEQQDSDLHTLILIMGGLHTEKSFLGSIGYVMSRSGLQQLLEVIYAPIAMLHIMSVKAISRARR